MKPILVTHKEIPPFVPMGAKVLILGSLPSVASREAGFYYMHPSNRFYAVLAGLWKEEVPQGIEERKKFLTRHHIALYDAIESCEIIGSSDSSIRHVVAAKNTIEKIQKEHFLPVFTTGKKAHSIYRKYIGNDDVVLPSPSAANASCSLSELIRDYQVLLPLLEEENKKC
ncbi:MAG: DNA-deoxyinosine glycosylase [Erysipelotrichaceae bacterium]|nr:DNA-deoxyinosine glycosylase [Erysipelotrichaceae bacterium]